jgi:hypothetical protein
MEPKEAGLRALKLLVVVPENIFHRQPPYRTYSYMRPQVLEHSQQPMQAPGAVPPPIPELKPETLYGVEPRTLSGYNKWYIVDNIGLAEKQAGAHLDDIGIICILPGKTELIDTNLSHKARPNFRGVYVSKARNLRCYYFNPAYRRRDAGVPTEAAFDRA